MAYGIVLSPRAEKELRKIRDRRQYLRLRDAIRALGETPRPPGVRKLQGRDAWRIRVGQMRVIYRIEDDVLVVTVIAVRHRSNAYHQQG